MSMLIGMLLALASAGQNPSQCAGGTVQQLRIYEIFGRNKAAFHDRFRDHAQRIMKRYGFRIIAMSETPNGDRSEFVYLLDWPDEAMMRKQWAAFLADEEWIAIKRETAARHGQLVGEIEERVLPRTAYSPC